MLFTMINADKCKQIDFIGRFTYSVQTYQVGAHFEALNEPVLMAPLDFWYTQVGVNLFSGVIRYWREIEQRKFLLEDVV